MQGFLSYEYNTHQTSYKSFFIQTVEIKDFDIIINGVNFFDQPVKNDVTTIVKFEKLRLFREIFTEVVAY